MNADEFRIAGKQMIDYIADYLENIRNRPVLPSVKPFYIRDLIPAEAPQKPETWKQIFDDLEKVVMNGMTHWHSPHFHAYFPTGNSYPGILGGMLSDALSCIGFTWYASPACTELEMQMCDWVAKAIDLPSFYLFSSNEKGGGIIQGSMSEATLVVLLAAKHLIKLADNLNEFKQESFFSKMQTNHSDSLNAAMQEMNIMDKHILTLINNLPYFDSNNAKLVIYCSNQAHSSVEKAAFLASVHLHKVEPTLTKQGELGLDSLALEKAIQQDLENHLIPFFVTATLGTTSTLAFDKIDELGPIAKKYNLWLHVDAAYAGSAFVCPEYRTYMKCSELTDSFAINPHKWMLVNFDCSILWIKDSKCLTNAMNVSPAYLKYENEGQIPDYRNWQIPLGRRFRSLKLWFVLRLYGIQGIRKHIRKQVLLAIAFSNKIQENYNFEITHPVILGLVCFRFKGTNEENKELVNIINDRKKIHLMSTVVNKVCIIRFAICSRFTELNDVDFAYNELILALKLLFQANKNKKQLLISK